MFGGSSRCPTCDKAVYAAEQIIGPGRKLYHKPCLACMTCKKRLDSYTLLEHDLQPYCKNCHTKNFGTHLPGRNNSPLRTANRSYNFDGGLSRPRSSTPSNDAQEVLQEGDGAGLEEGGNETQGTRPLMQTATGTRYGTALENGQAVATNNTGSPRKWGGSNPSCGKCGMSVYFAEQVKAVGKTWHKGCLRCQECNTLLDSTRLRDREGVPMCSSCYSKLHGPTGWKLGG